MILVAITGNVCSGKSFLLKIIEGFDYKVFSFDEEVGKLLREKVILDKIKKNFPETINGLALNKKLLAEIIFNNEEKKRKLEEILYHKLFIRENKFIEKSKDNGEKIVFCEIPLLYEKKLEGKYDFIITSFVAEEILEQRAMERNIDLKMFHNILKNQLPSKEKEKRADYSVNTDASLISLQKEMRKLIDKILI